MWAGPGYTRAGSVPLYCNQRTGEWFVLKVGDTLNTDFVWNVKQSAPGNPSIEYYLRYGTNAVLYQQVGTSFVMRVTGRTSGTLYGGRDLYEGHNMYPSYSHAQIGLSKVRDGSLSAGESCRWLLLLPCPCRRQPLP